MATERVRMGDLVVVLPGITGSVLQKNGKDLWALTPGAVLRAIRNGGRDLETMLIRDDDPEDLEPKGAITATRLMTDVSIIPRLLKVDGYTGVGKLIRSRFNVQPGSITDKYLANYFEFPYDWRRDNRVAARLLSMFIDDRLRLWREGANDKAKVIILAHSMGGLIARYYLEVLGGWQTCRALITFGTPFAGAVNALNFLSNGYKAWFIDMTEVMRTFPSVYQLLPTYKVIESDGELKRVSDVMPGGLNRQLVAAAVDFHREIKDAAESNRRNPDYLRDKYLTFPMVGVNQPTLQSATYSGGELSAGRALPDGMDPLLGEGDGTVPQLSAVPFDLVDEQRDTFYGERHGSLQNNRTVLDYIYDRLGRLQIKDWSAFQGGVGAASVGSISLDVDDVYSVEEGVSLRARVVDGDKQVVDPPTVHSRWGGLSASFVSNDGLRVSAVFTEAENGWEASSLRLPPGIYRVEVETALVPETAPPAVHDVFEVIGDA